MLRVLLTVILPILLPILLYAGYIALMRRRAQAAGQETLPEWHEGPWLWLVLAGSLLLVALSPLAPLLTADPILAALLLAAPVSLVASSALVIASVAPSLSVSPALVSRDSSSLTGLTVRLKVADVVVPAPSSTVKSKLSLVVSPPLC